MDNLVAKPCDNETLKNLKRGRILIKKLFDNNEITHRFIQEKIFVDSGGNIDVIEIYNSNKQNVERLFNKLNKEFLNLIRMNDKIHKNSNVTQLLIPYRSYKYLFSTNFIFNVSSLCQSCISYLFAFVLIFFWIYIFLVVIVNINHSFPHLYPNFINVIRNLFTFYLRDVEVPPIIPTES